MSLYFYVLYKKEIIHKNKSLSVLFFILSILSKPTTATLPAVLVLLDLTIFNDKKKIYFDILIYSLKDKIPYIIAGIWVIILAFVAQSEDGVLRSLSAIPLSSRLETSINNIFIYISQIYFPYNLASFYPQVGKSLYIILFYLIIISSWFFLAVRYFSKSKVITFSILFFFIQIIPMSGLFQTGAHSVANRYMYIPAIGFFFVSSYFIGKISNRLFYASLALILIVTLTVTSYSYAKVWRSDLSLWENNASVTESNYFTAGFYSMFLIENGRADEAARYFYNIIGISNKFFAIQAIEDVSIKLMEYKHYIDAKVILEKAIENNFKVVEVYRQLVFVEYFHFNNKDIAKKYLQAILKSKPSDLRSNRLLGMILFDQKKYQEALNVYIKLKENKYTDKTFEKDILTVNSLLNK